MTTTNQILPPLNLTIEDVIDTLIKDKDRFGVFSLLRMKISIDYMEKNFSDEDQEAVWRAVAKYRNEE